MSKPTGTCVVCKKFAELRCAACHSVFYCGKDHQKGDWQNHKKNCQSYQVKSSPGLDYVVARRKIKKNEVIVDETPLVVGPEWFVLGPDYKMTERDEICLGCHRSGKCWSFCPRCTWPVCKQTCPGLTDLTRHGAECSILRKMTEAFSFFRPPANIVLPLRCLLLQKTDPEKWKALLDLAVSAVKMNINSAFAMSKWLLLGILKPLQLDDPDLFSDEKIQKVYAVISAYGFRVKNPGFGHLVAVCGVSCVMEHSCLPNARRSIYMAAVDERNPSPAQLQCRVVMRAVQNIRKGDRISASFVDTWLCTWLRQTRLHEQRGVYCECARCLDPGELETDFGTLKCRKRCFCCARDPKVKEEECSGWLLPVDTRQITSSDWKCGICGNTKSAMDVRLHYFDGIPQMIKVNPVTFTANFGVRTLDDVESMECHLRKLQTVLHPNHYFGFLVKEKLIHLYVGRFVNDAFFKWSNIPDAHLKMTAEFCGEVLYMMTKLAIVNIDVKRFAETLWIWSATKLEIAKRNTESGESAPGYDGSALREYDEMKKRAESMKNAQFNLEEDIPFELIAKVMSLFLVARLKAR